MAGPEPGQSDYRAEQHAITEPDFLRLAGLDPDNAVDMEIYRDMKVAKALCCPLMMPLLTLDSVMFRPAWNDLLLPVLVRPQPNSR